MYVCLGSRKLMCACVCVYLSFIVCVRFFDLEKVCICVRVSSVYVYLGSRMCACVCVFCLCAFFICVRLFEVKKVYVCVCFFLCVSED